VLLHVGLCGGGQVTEVGDGPDLIDIYIVPAEEPFVERGIGMQVCQEALEGFTLVLILGPEGLESEVWLETQGFEF
jgi:hypothetical protein